MFLQVNMAWAGTEAGSQTPGHPNTAGNQKDLRVWGREGESGLARVNARTVEKPSVGDLGTALSGEGTKASHSIPHLLVVLDEGDSPCLSKLLCSWQMMRYMTDSG